MNRRRVSASLVYSHFHCLIRRRCPPTTTLFPYTTLFRSTHADPTATRTLLGLYHRARFAPHAVIGASDVAAARRSLERIAASWEDRKSTRLNSSHVKISYAVFCLIKQM